MHLETTPDFKLHEGAAMSNLCAIVSTMLSTESTMLFIVHEMPNESVNGLTEQQYLLYDSKGGSWVLKLKMVLGQEFTGVICHKDLGFILQDTANH